MPLHLMQPVQVLARHPLCLESLQGDLLNQNVRMAHPECDVVHFALLFSKITARWHALNTIGHGVQASGDGNKQAAADAAVQALEKEAAQRGAKGVTAVVAVLKWD